MAVAQPLIPKHLPSWAAVEGREQRLRDGVAANLKTLQY